MDPARANSPETPPTEGEDASREEKKIKKVRRATSPLPSGNRSRFFLPATNVEADTARLVLGEEIATEDEVLVAAFKMDVPFYRVETLRARAEKKGRQMILRKQS